MKCLKPLKQLTWLFTLIALITTSLLSSCAKDADPSLIQVASGPPGTAFNTGGSNGGTTAGAGTITFTLNGQSYTLKNNPPNYFVMATYFPAGGSIPSPTATLAALSPSMTGVTFTLGAFNAKAGVCDAEVATISMADGTSYGIGSTGGKIDFKTFNVSGNKLSCKGTFDIALLNASDLTKPIQVTGTFDL
ncbi:hypothetical protein [Mucilaginibacter terrae]|uniref:Lipocalin-like domain-containing protein n=1 Tax=Mucilaginibacter terrae TaxID=1955052 RepID=A0ABU3GYZ4_9SPHI|nr:hypothetical protein [Mucilaginibacter terrae]MDT3404982.1 hypothetical protein [Mucilaginibacter terrae]